MQILYIWIENYKSIKKQGFNLGGQYIFNYDQKQNVLTAKTNPHYIKDFFTPDTTTGTTITNVTAVIGSNGAGKTPFLDFIKEYMADRDAWTDVIKAVIVIGKNNNGKLNLNDLQIKSKGLPKKPKSFFDEKDTDEIPGGTINSNERIKEHANHIIFFSNIFDGHPECGIKPLHDNKILNSDSGSYYTNISTNYMVLDDYRGEVLDRENKSYDPVGGSTQVAVHYIKERQRQILFINNQRNELKEDFEKKFKDKFNFTPPKQLEIKALRNFASANYDYKSWEPHPLDNDQKNGEYRTKFKDFIGKTVAKLLRTSSLKERFIINSFLNFVTEKFTYTNFIGVAPQFDFSSMDSFLKSSAFSKLKEFIDTLDEKKFRNNNLPKDVVLVLPFKEAAEFLNLYQAATISGYFIFDWGIVYSSGENAMLQMFSRFYQFKITKISNDKVKGSQNLLIMIDEGDLYLHPQWQKQFLNSLMKFLCNIYENKKIQIILTSNAPIVASDLPSSNIIFLKQNKENGNSEVVKIEREQTFAANISSLLRDSFFIEGGMIGEFAAGKINEVITLLNAGNKVELLAQKEKVKKIIGLIGEPVIRHKLMSMLDDCLKLHLLDVDEEIEELKKRLKKLEQQKQEKQK